MSQRREFVALAMAGTVALAELCRRFGISRQTAYRLLSRHRAEGEAGLADRSRRPHCSPGRTPPEVERLVVDLRLAHPAWGGRKLARRLRDLGCTAVPSPSTVTAILRRHELLAPPEAARSRPPQRFERAAPNELWQMDFKGHFALDAGRCHALSVLDDHSRYAIWLGACAEESGATVRRQLTAAFRRYGLPEAMLADNGAPWGSAGGELSALEVWLLQLGIALRHGRPAHPQTQGKDERFHRTLEVELLQMHRLADLATAQAAFDRWRTVYNHDRPHEALGLATPASRYQPSPRPFPETLPEPLYHSTDQVRRVRTDGSVKFHGHLLRLSQALAGHHVAFRPTPTDGLWQAFYSRFPIKSFDLRHHIPAKPQTVTHVPVHVSPLSPV